MGPVAEFLWGPSFWRPGQRAIKPDFVFVSLFYTKGSYRNSLKMRNGWLKFSVKLLFFYENNFLETQDSNFVKI